MYYLNPFSHFARGSQPSVLNINFQTYIWPRFIFSEPLWIFRIKTPFRYSADFEYGYKTIFEKLERLYISCGRKILGAYPTTSGLSVLVRLGWLPLEYRLALNAIMWCMRILNNKAGRTLNAFYSSINTDPLLLSHTATIQPAIDFVNYLNNFSSENLFNIPFPRIKKAIQIAMFSELSDYWKITDIGRHLFLIHKDWKPRRFSNKTFSRITTCYYHSFACGHGYLRARTFKYGICSSPDCRHGCNSPETAEHILLHCPFYNKERNMVLNACNSHNLEISIGTFLSSNLIQIPVERLLARFVNEVATDD